jgi:hypothetical protein
MQIWMAGYLAISKHVSNVRNEPYSIHVPLTLPSSVTDLYFLVIHWQYISSFCNCSTRIESSTSQNLLITESQGPEHVSFSVRFPFNTDIPYKNIAKYKPHVFTYLWFTSKATQNLFPMHFYFFILFSSSPLKYCVCILSHWSHLTFLHLRQACSFSYNSRQQSSEENYMNR